MKSYGLMFGEARLSLLSSLGGQGVSAGHLVRLYEIQAADRTLRELLYLCQQLGGGLTHLSASGPHLSPRNGYLMLGMDLEGRTDNDTSACCTREAEWAVLSAAILLFLFPPPSIQQICIKATQHIKM